MLASADSFRLVRWQDVGEDESPCAPALAAGWLRAWLSDPEHRVEVLEAYRWLVPLRGFSKGWMDDRDLNAFVRPRIERAVETGELVLVRRAPMTGWKPLLQEPDEVHEAYHEPEAPAPTKTWIEFQVVDMSGNPIGEVKYEALLADGSKKNGKTGKDGLVRFEDLDPGLVEVKLVEYDGEAVESAEEADRRKPASAASPPPPPPPAAAPEPGEEIADEIYVVAAELKSIGETLLADTPVRILDAETGEQVGGDLKTDEKGVVRAEVPDDKPYRIEIADDSIEPAPANAFHPDLPPAVLACLFVDSQAKPIANEAVEVVADGASHPLETDDKGRIHSDAPLGPCQLKIRKQTFVAHGLPAADASQDANLYRFVVEDEK